MGREGPVEHKLGAAVIIKLPESRGGATRLKVVSGSSCTQCKLSGLGHTLCREIKCGREIRSDGHSIVYQEVEDGNHHDG
jgi:hypothetical protein